MKFCIIWGTRPEIIKFSPIIRELQKRGLSFDIIDTGQHYNFEMSKIFYNQFQLPNPSYKFDIPKADPHIQISFMISSISEALLTLKPDIVLAQGDTNTVLASSLASLQTNTPFGHVEAGLRSFDPTMPEEFNRKIAGVIANLHFCPTDIALQNLKSEGYNPDRLFVTGNTIVDALDFVKNDIEIKNNFNKKFDLNNDILLIPVTLHRPSNVDNEKILLKILTAFNSIDATFLLLTHPRTEKKISSLIKDFNLEFSNIIFDKPWGYFEFLNLIHNSPLVITDSGGIQEECAVLNKPCITLRSNTERPESVLTGFNKLIDPSSPSFEKNLVDYLNSLIKKRNIENKSSNPYGDGKASNRIIDICLDHFDSDKLRWKSPDYTSYYPSYKISSEIDQDSVIFSFDKEGHLLFSQTKDKGKSFVSKSKLKY